MGFEINRHAGVNHHDLGPCLARQRVDGSAPGQEVEHHLWSNLGGVRRNALRSYAVVAGGHYDRLAGNGGYRLPRNASQLN